MVLGDVLFDPLISVDLLCNASGFHSVLNDLERVLGDHICHLLAQQGVPGHQVLWVLALSEHFSQLSVMRALFNPAAKLGPGDSGALRCQGNLFKLLAVLRPRRLFIEGWGLFGW